MTIFVLDKDPVISAQMHMDKHVVKMPLETAQMLSTICGGPYKPTHRNHPCTIWARSTKSNYSWLVELGIALCKEYTHRYGKVHKCQAIIEQLTSPPDNIPDGELTTFAQAMPDDCKTNNVIESYRKYYKLHKGHIAHWKNRQVPEFMQ